MKKGDIVLIPFPFSDLSGSKLRPSLIIIESQKDITVAFITTQIKWKEPTDILLKPTNSNGLKRESLIRLSKLATLDKDIVIGRLGSITSQEITDLNTKLKVILKLGK
jgi:mRNA interferase MazF